MRKLLVPIVLIALVLAIPVVPFLVFGESLEARMESWLDATLPKTVVAAWVMGLLAIDVFLPVPSSIVSTFAASQLGFWLGTAVSWVGMTFGAVLAFALARVFGRRLALWLSGEEDLAWTDVLSRRFGPMVLVLARPVPVFAEASVLVMGTTALPWRRLLIAVGLSNLGIAAAYAALGDRVRLPIALGASIALPLLATALARYAWRASRSASHESEPGGRPH